jgi:hypothetical protein
LLLGGGYLPLALLLPLLLSWACAGLVLFVSLLFPGLTQPGATASVAGGNVAGSIAVLPAIATLLAFSFGVNNVGPLRFLLVVGGIAVVLSVATLACVVLTFRPDRVLGS